MNYNELKKHYTEVIDKDKTLYTCSNDINTPIECVEEMISKIPKDFFNKKNIKILDPCCGSGNFHLTLKHKYNINDNNLYFNDINTKRLNNVKKIFPNCKNITNLDYLNDFKTDTKFDLIVANPPYAKINIDGKRASKNHNLIKDFLEKSLDLLKDDGYLLFITPNNWMSLSDRNKLIEKITSLQIIYLNIHGAKKYFSRVGSSFTWYVIQNKPFYTKIEVDCLWKNKIYNSYINSQIRSYIPLFYTNIIQNIINKTLDANNIKFNIQTSSYLHKHTKRDIIKTIKDNEYKYKLIHTPKQTVYCNKEHKYQDGYKVFISLTDKYKVFIENNCGMTQSIAFILALNLKQAQEYKLILDHPLYIFLNNIHRYGNFNNVRILQKFPLLTIKEIEKLLTKEELSFINVN